jgi:hypothetical protein
VSRFEVLAVRPAACLRTAPPTVDVDEVEVSSAPTSGLARDLGTAPVVGDN